MDSTGIPSIKRLHSERATEFGDATTSPKRQRPESTSGNPSEHSNTPNVRQALLDALRDISDEIRFAVKCMDRHAGDEAIKMTLTNISNIATRAVQDVAFPSATTVKDVGFQSTEGWQSTTSEVSRSTSASTLPLSPFSVLPTSLQRPVPPLIFPPVLSSIPEKGLVETRPTTNNVQVDPSPESSRRGRSRERTIQDSDPKRHPSLSRTRDNIQNYDPYRPNGNSERLEPPRLTGPPPPPRISTRQSEPQRHPSPRRDSRRDHSPIRDIPKRPSTRDSPIRNIPKRPSTRDSPPHHPIIPSGPKSDIPTRPTIPPGLHIKLESRLAQECTLKFTSPNTPLETLNIPDLLVSLRLPNLLRLEIKNNALYLRLLDSASAGRVASSYKNHPKDKPLPQRRLLDSVKVSHPADYAPFIPIEVINYYREGARRRLRTMNFIGIGEYDVFLVSAKKLWGYVSVVRTVAGRVFISFDGVESAIEGKRILERKFNDVQLEYADELK